MESQQMSRRPVILTLALVASAAGTFQARRLEARDCRVTLFPNGSRFSCVGCHVSSRGGENWNAFGLAVQAAIKDSHSCNVLFWTPELAALDSDGDGLTNGEELLDTAGTWKPGDPNPVAGAGQKITNPGVKEVVPRPKYIRGDFNGDGKVNVTDAVGIALFLFKAGGKPLCETAADVNADRTVDTSDAVALCNYLFVAGPGPAAPFPGCGTSAAGTDCSAGQVCS